MHRTNFFGKVFFWLNKGMSTWLIWVHKRTITNLHNLKKTIWITACQTPKNLKVNLSGMIRVYIRWKPPQISSGMASNKFNSQSKRDKDGTCPQLIKGIMILHLMMLVRGMPHKHINRLHIRNRTLPKKGRRSSKWFISIGWIRRFRKVINSMLILSKGRKAKRKRLTLFFFNMVSKKRLSKSHLPW